MARDRFTLKESTFVHEDVNEMFCALSKKNQGEFIGHLNDIFLFISAAGDAAEELAKSTAPEKPSPPDAL